MTVTGKVALVALEHQGIHVRIRSKEFEAARRPSRNHSMDGSMPESNRSEVGTIIACHHAREMRRRACYGRIRQPGVTQNEAVVRSSVRHPAAAQGAIWACVGYQQHPKR